VVAIDPKERRTMLQLSEISRVVDRVARSNLRGEVVRVLSEPTIDSTGEDAIRVMIVLTPGAADRISGEAALNTLVGIQRGLEEAGENRLAIVEYATEEELAEVDEP